MRIVLFAVVFALASLGCATPSTVVIGPPCAKLTSDDDKARELGHNALVFDHSFDLPMRHRAVHVEYPDGTTRDVIVTSDHQDSARVVAGCAFGTCGAVELGLGALTANTTAALEDYAVGAALLVGGGSEIIDGWRPDQATEEIVDEHGVCAAKPAPAAAPASPPTTPTAPSTAPPTATTP